MRRALVLIHIFAAAHAWHIACRRTHTPRMDTSEDLLHTLHSARPLAFSVSLLSSIRDVRKCEWDALAVQDESPFAEWDWLYSLESSGCACAETGWTPYHIVVRQDETHRMVAVLPMYLKSHSMGEFTADAPWADAAQQRGIRYYPKLLCAIPFTPVQGARVLLSHELPAGVRAQLLLLVAKYLRTLAQQNGISSVHLNFCTDEEVAAFTQAGFLHQQSVQYRWMNEDDSSEAEAEYSVGTSGKRPYADFNAFLAGFRSKRRTQILRERRIVAESGVKMRVLTGEQVRPELMSLIFHIYKRTVDRNVWGRQYLNEQFFTMLGQRFQHRMHVVLAMRSGEIVAATCNILKDGVLYGRYWGSLQDSRFLHFEACYYTPLENVVKQGWKRFEPGAGTPQSRLWRGFKAVNTHSVHYFCDNELQNTISARLQAHRQRLQGKIEPPVGRSLHGRQTVLRSSSVLAHGKRGPVLPRWDEQS
ncbi:hypothetical protein AB1Y20_017923 [Prymnesium parvum]|uniref:GNAT family N-acetyltransferase n=1 Tax=Prymnesium parvum TaxID=97485 RepID=A0AB34JLY9_PRYPA